MYTTTQSLTYTSNCAFNFLKKMFSNVGDLWEGTALNPKSCIFIFILHGDIEYHYNYH